MPTLPWRGRRGATPEGARAALDLEPPNTAAWFARRLSWLADPAEYVADVPGEAVLAYVRGRGEDDYLVVLPPDVRPRRLPTLPEPIRPGSAVTP